MYVVPSDPDGDCIIICINLVLPMGWMDSSKFFCAFSEMFTDTMNALVDTELPIPAYGYTVKILTTGPPPLPPHTRASPILIAR